MEAAEYERMYRLEESFWWYCALHRRALAAARRCLRRPAEPPGGGPLPRPGSDATPARHRILDAGCGTGGMAVHLASLGEVTALDISPVALRFARRRLPRDTDLALSSVERLPVRDDAFDLVVSLDVLCNGAVEAEQAALAEMARVLCPGGHLILNLPAFEALLSEHDRQVRNVRRYNRPQVCGMLLGAGLRPVELHYWNSFLFLPAALVRLARRGRDGGRSELKMPPRWLNSLLTAVVTAEQAVGRRLALPFGLSIFAVAQRPPAGAGG